MNKDILTPRERWQQKCVDITPTDIIKLEETMLNYFTANENNILAIQKQYQETGKAIDVVTATEYALRLDLHNNNKESQERIRPLECVLQYLMAVNKARKKRPTGFVGDFEIIHELKTVSQSFRPNYLDEMLVVEGFLENYAQFFQHKFMEIVEKDHVA